MASRTQHEKQRTDRAVFQRAAGVVRADASRQRVEAVAGRAEPVPVSRWALIAVLEELGRSAGAGGLSVDLLREAREWAEKLIAETPEASG